MSRGRTAEPGLEAHLVAAPVGLVSKPRLFSGLSYQWKKILHFLDATLQIIYFGLMTEVTLSFILYWEGHCLKQMALFGNRHNTAKQHPPLSVFLCVSVQ